jgi:acetylornithine/N-succinyldiaminopimelate aminotransferase
MCPMSTRSRNRSGWPQLLTDQTFADTVFFTNSGTETAELAIKMARKFHHDAGQPERVEIIAFEGAFHGRSTGAIAAAGSEKMVKGFGPLMPGFVHLKWPASDADHAAIRAAITDRTCAVIIEPIQGEGGIRVVPDQCLKGLRDLCDQTGTLLIFDEVQCGMGRTGKLFAHEWAGVTPDIMMVAKGIGGGFPLGAVLATERAASGMTQAHTARPTAATRSAARWGRRSSRLISDPAFLTEVGRKGALLRQGLESLVARHPQVFEAVRGEGLILGLKCKPAPADVVKAGYEAGILTVAAADNVLRLLPALNIPDADIAEALTRLDEVATQLEQAA